jgi:hypothetical protein
MVLVLVLIEARSQSAISCRDMTSVVPFRTMPLCERSCLQSRNMDEPCRSCYESKTRRRTRCLPAGIGIPDGARVLVSESKANPRAQSLAGTGVQDNAF